MKCSQKCTHPRITLVFYSPQTTHHKSPRLPNQASSPSRSTGGRQTRKPLRAQGPRGRSIHPRTTPDKNGKKKMGRLLPPTEKKAIRKYIGEGKSTGAKSALLSLAGATRTAGGGEQEKNKRRVVRHIPLYKTRFVT